MGRSPGRVYAANRPNDESLDEETLTSAFTERRRRRLRRDGTLSVDGTTYELTESFAREGGYVTVGRSLIDPQCSVWVEHDEVRIPLRPVDPVANSKRKRQAAPEPEKTVDFDPATALVERTIGRSRRPKG